jgi:AAA domain/Primase C terminal 2 (PriCT-2)/Bifunctional DNA primase/polymerase, N-terminal
MANDFSRQHEGDLFDRLSDEQKDAALEHMLECIAASNSELLDPQNDNNLIAEIARSGAPNAANIFLRHVQKRNGPELADALRKCLAQRSNGPPITVGTLIHAACKCGANLEPWSRPVVEASLRSLLKDELESQSDDGALAADAPEALKPQSSGGALIEPEGVTNDARSTPPDGVEDTDPAPATKKKTARTERKPKSDDLPYTGLLVEVPEQGPDILDEHGAPADEPQPTPTENTITGPPSSEPRRCVHCKLDPPDGTERTLDADLWIHPRCETAYITARMAEEGLAQEDAQTPQQAHEILTKPNGDGAPEAEQFLTAPEPGAHRLTAPEPDSHEVRDVTALRLHLRKVGLHPIPLEGKIPPMKGWQQKFDVSEEEIRRWEKTYPCARNTGVLAKPTPGLDIDIRDETAAEAVEALAREFLEEHGDIHVRFGLPPKRLIPLRTDEPFNKLTRTFSEPKGPDGKNPKIEILGNGQQYVVAGIHPDTGAPYRWFGGDLATIKRENLPYIRREDMERFLDAATKLLVEEHGFVLEGGTTRGDNGGEPGAEPQAEGGLIAAALAVIPNNANWDGWNNIGMAVWRATAGSEAGRAAWDAWSKKNPAKYDARNTAEKWAAYFKSPPTRIGAGTIFYLADQASPGWRQDYEARGKEASGAEQGEGIMPFHRHGERPPLDDRSWMIDTLIPEVGTGLISGQWGTLKTFLALELARCIMTARPFLNFDIVRPGGVLLIALEGQNEVAIRIQGALEKGTEHHKDAPFYWCDECPPLTDPKSADIIIKTAKWIAREFQERFDLPLSLILIDSLIAGAGYRKEGQDNDAALTNTIMANMAKVSRALGCFVFVIDHFGKDTNVGTRGSSVKEGDADVIFACLGDRSEAGQVTNSRLALRKRRSGPNGEEFPFRGQVVDMGLNPKTGKTETTLVINGKRQDKPAPPKKMTGGAAKR